MMLMQEGPYDNPRSGREPCLIILAHSVRGSGLGITGAGTE